MLTVEYNKKIEAVEVFCDREGLIVLLQQLQLLGSHGGHIHMMTPSWAGNELAEELQRPGNELIHHLRIALAPEQPNPDV